MKRIFSTAEANQLKELFEISDGAWIHLTNPEKEEIQAISEQLEIPEDFLRAALDEEETPRIDYENGATLIIVDIPVVTPEKDSFMYNTLPLGIIITNTNTVTVCLEEVTLIEDFWTKRVKNFDTCKKTRFLLQLLYRNASKYLNYLRQIDKSTTQMEEALHKSMKNRELLQMLRLEKSLVYFATSLKSNEVVLEKILKTSIITKYPDDTELLEDVIIENKQAIEMCSIYRDILSGTMDAFASIISNNLNIVMKIFAAITILLSIPTLFSSLWGMNTAVPWEGTMIGFYIVLGIALVATAIAGIILWKKKMF